MKKVDNPTPITLIVTTLKVVRIDCSNIICIVTGTADETIKTAAHLTNTSRL